MKHENESLMYQLIILAIVVLIVFFANGLGAFVFRTFKMDLTENKSYSLSKASKDAVTELNKELYIHAFFSKDLSAPYNDVEPYLRDLLAEYNVHSNKYFKYRFYDCTIANRESSTEIEKNIKMANSFGIYPTQIQSYGGSEFSSKQVYMGVAIQHGDLVDTIDSFRSVTRGLEYKLTSSISQMRNKVSYLIGLEEKIQVRAYISSGLFRSASDKSQLLSVFEQAVEQINRDNYNMLSYEYVEPELDAEFLEFARDIGAQVYEVETEDGGTDPAAAFVTIEHGDSIETLPVSGEFFELDNTIAALESTANTLLDINDSIQYLTGNGSLELARGQQNPAMQQQQQAKTRMFTSAVGDRYAIKEVSALDIDNTIPSLVIAGPKESFSEYELYKIDQYLMQGRDLIIFQDTVQQIQIPQQYQQQFGQRQQFREVSTGLDKLLEHYGLDLQQAVVLDKNNISQLVKQETGRQELYYVPNITRKNFTSDKQFLNNIYSIFMAFPGYAKFDNSPEQKEIQPSVQARKLFTSSGESWTASVRELSSGFMRPPQDKSQFDKYPLAWVLEGEFVSYFADKERPAPPEGMDGDESALAGSSGAFASKGKPGKIFFAGSSELITDELMQLASQLRMPNAADNKNFVMNVVDHMNGKDSWALMRTKEQRFRPLDPYGEPQEKNLLTNRDFITYFLIIFPPLFVILVAFAVFVIRALRKKSIRQLYT